MAKKAKKIDVKKMAKVSLADALKTFLTENDYDVTDGKDVYGFTEGSIVVHTTDTDVQIKLITPKAGLNRYETLEAAESIEDTNDVKD